MARASVEERPDVAARVLARIILARSFSPTAKPPLASPDPEVSLSVRFEAGQFPVFDYHVVFDRRRYLVRHRLFALACQTPGGFPHPTSRGRSAANVEL